MTIDVELKRNLIADVENVCELNLDAPTKIALTRCFEITIGTHYAEHDRELLSEFRDSWNIKDTGHACIMESDIDEFLTSKEK